MRLSQLLEPGKARLRRRHPYGLSVEGGGGVEGEVHSACAAPGPRGRQDDYGLTHAHICESMVVSISADSSGTNHRSSMCWHVMDGESRSFLVFAWALLAVFQSSHFHLPPSSSSLNTTAAFGLCPSRITHVSPSNLPRYLLVLPRWSTSTSWRTWRLPSAICQSSKQTTTPSRSGKGSLDTRLPRLPSSCESTEPVSYQQSPQSTGSWHVMAPTVTGELTTRC